jgi:hypothetical protein
VPRYIPNFYSKLEMDVFSKEVESKQKNVLKSNKTYFSKKKLFTKDKQKQSTCKGPEKFYGSFMKHSFVKNFKSLFFSEFGFEGNIS